MTLLPLILVVALVVAGWRRIEYWGYLKLGEAYERQASQRHERSNERRS